MEDHTVILILATIIFIVCLWMVYCSKSSAQNYAERYQQSFPSASSMSQAQINAALGNKQCSMAVDNLCSEAKGQNLLLPTKNLSNSLSQVQAACGADFPPYAVCAAKDPNFGVNTPMLLGGTHTNMP